MNNVAEDLDRYISFMRSKDRKPRQLVVYKKQLKELGKDPEFIRRADGAMFYRGYPVVLSTEG